MISLPLRLAAPSLGLRHLGGEANWLPRFVHPSHLASPAEADALLAWGRKPSASRTCRLGRRWGKPVIFCEDGFLRSVRPGSQEKTCSLVFDDLGIYYDCNSPSRLEELTKTPLSAEQNRRAQDLGASWRSLRISKYNHATNPRSLPAEQFILVVDQTSGDLSLSAGNAEAATFRRMLEAALSDHPTNEVILKLHPEVARGMKRGNFRADSLPLSPRLHILTDDIHPCDLLEKATAVYTATSQLGFEALIWGKPVRTFGLPFYAGWGLTHDELRPPSRRGQASLEQLIHAALISYPRYVHPLTRNPCEVEELMTHFAYQREHLAEAPPSLYASGFSRWKRRHLQRFFPSSHIKHVNSLQRIPSGSTVACWGKKYFPDEQQINFQIIRLEDGFLRSAGLGAALAPPVSWVTDRCGIYYDANHPSDLEDLLRHHDFTPAECGRASALRQRIAEAGINKYNLGGSPWPAPLGAKRVILVPGQVETDASILHGATDIKTNFALLQTVRQTYPTAYLVYKPHPDVLAGLRKRGRAEDQVHQCCDEVVAGYSIHDILQKVDEVHTITSLTGFEALLRGKTVVTYGRPFYAGWGLTIDKGITSTTASRRGRRLTLDELVFGTLIKYPVYVHHQSGHFITPEQALRELLHSQQNQKSRGFSLTRILRSFRKKQAHSALLRDTHKRSSFPQHLL